MLLPYELTIDHGNPDVNFDTWFTRLKQQEGVLGVIRLVPTGGYAIALVAKEVEAVQPLAVSEASIGYPASFYIGPAGAGAHALAD